MTFRRRMVVEERNTTRKLDIESKLAAVKEGNVYRHEALRLIFKGLGLICTSASLD